MIGIYKITNTTNDKCYIGQSRDIEARWTKHLSIYKHNSTPECELYRAFKKYGIKQFTFEVIEECSIEELNEREIYWIAHYDSFYNGYNMTLGGEACNGTNDKTVYQYDLRNNLIAIFHNACEAAESLGDRSKNSHITAVLNGKRKTAYGYKWSRTLLKF